MRRLERLPEAAANPCAAFSVLTVCVLAWGALAFGAVYPWAYAPLLVSLVGLGVWGVCAPIGTSARRVNRPLAIGLGLLISAIALQLVPVSRATLRVMSPSSDSLLLDYDIAYASPGPDGRPIGRHALSIQPDRTRLGLAFVSSLGIFLLGLTRALNAARLRALGPGLVVLGLVMAMVGIVQKPFFNGKIYGLWTPVAGAIPFGPAGGPFGPFVNRNHFAGWMLMVLPLVIGHACGTVARGTGRTGLDWRARLAWLSTREANQAVFAGCAILIMMLSLVMTLSRSGLVCLIVALLASALVVLRRSAKRWTTLVAVGCVMGLVVLTIGWAGMDAVANRFDQLRSDADGRILAWQDGWRVTSAFRWTGTGLNTYGIAMLFYQTFRVDTAHYAQAHNDYLQLLAEGGLLLLVPTLVLVTLFSREVFRRFRERRDDAYGYWVRCGAVTGLMTIAFQEVVDFSLQVPANAAMFALLCGIAARRPSGHVRPASTS